MLMDREADSEIQCDMDVKPSTERPCNEGECKPEDFDIGVIIKNTVVGISHWRIGPWSAVSHQADNNKLLLLFKYQRRK